MLRGRDDATQPRRRAMSTMAACAAVATAVVLALMPFDDVVFRAVRGSDLAALRIMRAVTDIGRSVWYLAASAILAVALLGLARRSGQLRRRLRRAATQAGFVFAAIAVSGLVTNGLKILVGRARPILHDAAGAWSFDPLTPGYAHASFPSGHATTIGALAILAMMAWPKHRAGIAVLMVLAGFTRVPALAHYPSDVAAGLFVGIAVTVAMARGAAARRQAGLRYREGAVLPVFVGKMPVGTRFWRA